MVYNGKIGVHYSFCHKGVCMAIMFSLVSSSLILAVSVIALSCTQAQVRKDEAVLAKIAHDGKTMIITGCKDLPIVETDVNLVAGLVPVSGVASAVVLSEDVANKVCAVVAKVQSSQVAPVPASVGGK